jgi:hypothetical protein
MQSITMSTANANEVVQVFALTESATATYANPSGAFEPMPGTALKIKLKVPSLLVITFCGRGAVTPSGGPIIPFVFIKCEIDGSPCHPNSNPIEFLYPQFCCDSRSFTWVVPEVKPGTHKIAIMWGMGNPTGAILTQRTLTVYAAKV